MRPTGAQAGCEGLVETWAAAGKGGTGALDGEEALRGAHAAATVAGLAADRLGTALGAAAAAGLAGRRAGHADLRGLAAEGVFQADFHVVAQIGAARRRAAAAAAHESAEPPVEDVGKAAGRAPHSSGGRRGGNGCVRTCDSGWWPVQ